MWRRREKDENHVFHVKANRRKKEVIPGNPVPENRAKNGQNRKAKNHIKNEEKKKKRKDDSK